MSARQLQLIPVENCADCWFVRFRLQAATTKNWAENELKECKGVRCESLYLSNELVHYGLKNNSNALVEVLNNLNNSIGTDDNLEMYYWSLTSTFFRDRNIFEDYERLKDYSYLNFRHELGARRSKLIGAAINSGIIRQYLQEKYSEKKPKTESRYRSQSKHK